MVDATQCEMKHIPQLNIRKDSVIYVAAPARTFTGGPENLHQLAYHLRNDLGHTAFMYYIPPTVQDPVHPAFRTYNNPFVKQIMDSEQNLLIVPEVVGTIKILQEFRKVRKVVWWLSVNNFLISYVLQRRLFPKNVDIHIARLANKVARSAFKANLVDIRWLILTRINRSIILQAFEELNLKEVDLHLCQSYYAMEFLSSFAMENIAYLSDYLNKEFLSHGFKVDAREDIVVFNPMKGYAFARKIIAAAPDIAFIPIKNMTRNHVIELLNKAKVYIDFGDHPGKDRIPREAAVLGCCVIVGRRGSAANERDVPIPSMFKFEVNEQNIPKIVEAIRFCLQAYDEAVHSFDEYRSMIMEEPNLFLKDLQAIFGNTHG